MKRGRVLPLGLGLGLAAAIGAGRFGLGAVRAAPLAALKDLLELVLHMRQPPPQLPPSVPQN